MTHNINLLVQIFNQTYDKLTFFVAIALILLGLLVLIALIVFLIKKRKKT